MSASPANFHALKERLRFVGEIVLVTGLRIGSGGAEATDAVDLPVLKDADGYPLLPGASLKGVLRSTLEGLVRAVADPPGEGDPPPSLWSCDPLEKGCGHHREGTRDELDLTRHCSLCRLFGSQVVASHVRISDAMVPGDERRGYVPVERRDGVAIDRDLRIVHGKQKYDFEVVSPGTRFDLEVFVENPEDWMLGLLMLGFDQIDEGFTAVGGFTSRGLGRVRVRWTGATAVTAEGLLAGQPPEDLFGTLEDRRRAWREALAAKAAEKGAP